MADLDLFQDVRPLAAIATTPAGIQRLSPLCRENGIVLWVPETLADSQGTQIYSGALRDHLAHLWDSHRGFICCLATGAVVRLIAPLLRHKSQDPAVVVVDEAGRYAISLCSGHQGGADGLAQRVASWLGGEPVLTGAANGGQYPSVDMWGTPFGWVRGSGDWTGVSGAIARQEWVEVIQEAGSTLWQAHLPAAHRFQFGFPDYGPAGQEHRPAPRARVWISPIQRRFAPDADMPKVQWHPRVLWVGVGCERGTPRLVIETAVRQVFQAHHLAEGAIAGLATLDRKADEVGLVEFCGDRGFPLRCFPPEALRPIPVPTPSAIVEGEVGTPSVAEAAAILAASPDDAPLPATADRLRVPKQIFRLEGQPGAVTLAIAQAEQEYTGRTGQLFLVGTGPGALSQLTAAARGAIAQADAVIGYGLYVDLVRSLLRPGQIAEALPITQERQRAERAIELAQWGLSVAVISSGDCGIYGMAGLVLEQLQSQGWDGKTPGIQVFPGITALQAAAARVGAPLMHDFCAISLSDLLTPWEVIETRLRAAAQADFVTALYNPKSKTRTEQVAIAQSLFCQYRPLETPVALVRSAYREDEQVTLTTLEKFLDFPIDMVTTVLIGNRSTRRHGDWLITPRGYLGFGEG